MKKVACVLLLASAILAAWRPAEAAVKTRLVEYKDGNVRLEGFVAYDDALQGRRPTILVVHEWWGLNDYIKRRAEELAKLGFVAFAVDIYGKGIRAKTQEEAGKLSAAYSKDPALIVRRARAGMDEALKQPMADPGRMAAVGYCFGGGVVLNLVRSGAALAGAVTFHGALGAPMQGSAADIRAKLLVCHGANDPFVTQEVVAAFWNEMRAAKVDWQLNVYSNAVHGFTNPANGDDPGKGMAYNKEADLRSWQAMRDFFGEIFRE